jgi:SAM-dependent methyltransferase
MTGFSPTWLDLREPIDAASRSQHLKKLPLRRRPGSGVLPVLDLACGTGANLRYLAPRLGGAQKWTLVDNDPVLLGALPDRLAAWAGTVNARLSADGGHAMRIRGPGFECHVCSRKLDLINDMDKLETEGVQLVTASALLDLVSRQWLQALALSCHRQGVGVLFALNYDGRICIDPADPMDERLCELFNRHQCTDKGFGAALGPASALAVQQLFSGLGYQLQVQPSDWLIGPDQVSLQKMLVHGWLDAAVEMAPEEVGQLQAWSSRRGMQIETSRLQISVGHVDVVGWLP